MSLPPRVAALRVYPVKGAGAVAVDTWPLDDWGLRYDRLWAVIDAAGDVLTQRTHPRLALVRPAIDDAALRLDAPGMPTLELPHAARDPRRLPVTIWDDRCLAEPCGVAANTWWTAYLGEPAHLVRMPEETVRTASPSRVAPGARVAFPDGFPLLLLSQASLDGLNARLATPVPMSRFRPNIVVEGVPAHGEDDWERLRIGGVELLVAKPCERCVVTTVDQETARGSVEPLRTLATYRRRDGGVTFGQNLIHVARGTLRVGDAVRVESPH